ncbi:Uncharacterized conserved protein YaaN involved in tellurite resistance [Lentibacillus persicus]|uniref:Uncharacterized conserved protein YaaN involved in tellurite resistance n=1 Tax=Lentibacillus persicus TaxID=640948 RepID=A0A1I1V941_9BACI|nr:toxic anion resistance protein [Lentibacillus persicus]SFD77623.1 Uncharacterized conserved protein YaaN involved in tellurite resistance [Lentibacillus persicus]
MSDYKHSPSSDLDELLQNPFSQQDSNNLTNQDNYRDRLFDSLTEENKQKALTLKQQIDPNNFESVTEYGVEAQSKLHAFSHSMLEHVQKNDAGEIGNTLENLMKKLEQVNPDELKPEKRGVLSRMFGKISNSVNEILSRYQKTGAQIDRISLQLDNYKGTLKKDNELLQEVFDKNKDYFDALNIYIAAGEVKRDELENELIPDLKQKAEQSGNQMDVQKVNDMIQFAERLDKRVHDLRLSRQITTQSAPQIRLIQNTNQALVEKIQSSILTAIPLWKNQIAIALTIIRQRHATEAQKQVSQTTNDLLLKNSEMLKTNSTETAKETERGLVDIETLKQTQENLLSSIEETINVQAEGRERRLQAEKEMTDMEEELKTKLLELK